MSATPADQMTAIPGDAAGVRRHAARFTRTANAIEDAVAMLKAVADASRTERSDAVEALAGAVGDTRSRLSQIRERYEVAGSALTTYADELEAAQQSAARAIGERDTAQARLGYSQGHLDDARTATRSTVDPAELADATEAVRRYSALASGARGDILAAQTAHGAALQRVQEAGDRAATAIAKTVDSDGLNDSAWDNVLDWVNENAEWLTVVKDVLSVVTAIVGALSIFFPVLAPIALGLAVVTAGLSFLLAASGSGSWLDFGLDMLGVLTFGVGTAALGAIKLGGVALRGSRAVRLAVNSPSNVFGSTLREVGGNFLEHGIMGMARRPLTMVADDLAGAIPTRPGLASVLQQTKTPWMNEIRESGSVVISEFGRLASQARLGAGGVIDDLIISGGATAANVFRTSATIGSGLDLVNFTGMGIKYTDMLMPEGPVGDVVSTISDVWNIPFEAATHGMTDWSVTPPSEPAAAPAS